jgi:arabinogalactan endo-1,4-beta-galactosidase
VVAYRIVMKAIRAGLLLSACGVIAACSGSSSGSGSESNGGGNIGGAVASGGAFGSGGMTARAGSSAGGAVAITGGVSATGGTSSPSGTKTTGGNANTGGTSSTGGAVATGGSQTVGGTQSNAGTASTVGSKTTGGASSFGGAVNTGGSKMTGGAPATGGSLATGGSKATGGAPVTGGSSSAGGSKATGGVATTGGSKAAGGSTGNCPAVNPNLYAMGADLSQVPQDEAGGQTRYIDTDSTQKDIFAIMKHHGFNYVRLRTFVDPTASDGYSSQGYCDLNHTIAMAKRIKQACMGFLLDFHYSDNWADPGKQCIPVAWRAMTLAQMTQQVHDYTSSSVQALVNAGARPDIVQVGNEITPGMLIHICDSSGSPTSTNSVNGSVSNWSNLAGFLNAGIKGVHDVDPTIKVMLHIERGGSGSESASWISNALSHNVAFDVFGLSTYVAYQGQPSVWQSTFNTLVGNSAFSALKFASGEYNNEAVTSPAGTTSMRDINDTVFNIAGNRGFGTFFWEPTRYGAWGNGLFTWSGTSCTAISSAFAVYDAMSTAYSSRL